MPDFIEFFAPKNADPHECKEYALGLFRLGGNDRRSYGAAFVRKGDMRCALAIAYPSASRLWAALYAAALVKALNKPALLKPPPRTGNARALAAGEVGIGPDFKTAAPMVLVVIIVSLAEPAKQSALEPRKFGLDRHLAAP